MAVQLLFLKSVTSKTAHSILVLFPSSFDFYLCVLLASIYVHPYSRMDAAIA